MHSSPEQLFQTEGKVDPQLEAQKVDHTLTRTDLRQRRLSTAAHSCLVQCRYLSPGTPFRTCKHDSDCFCGSCMDQVQGRKQANERTPSLVDCS